MPAASSSPIDPAVGQLLAVARALGRDGKGVLALLAAFPDPRARRGVRHPVAVVLGLAVCAVLAGARSFVAIAEWAADADQATLDGLGVTGVVPCESTFRRVLQSLDADALDDAAGAWAQQRTAPARGGRRLIAADGKTLRGSAAAGQPGRHLLAAPGHDRGVVLGQSRLHGDSAEVRPSARRVAIYRSTRPPVRSATPSLFASSHRLRCATSRITITVVSGV